MAGYLAPSRTGRYARPIHSPPHNDLLARGARVGEAPVAGSDILVVDDDADIRSALGQVLELEGYDVAYASNGSEAWAWLQAGPPPGLVLLDLMMPVMDGAEFLRILRGDSRLGGLPVVLVSAFGSIATTVAAAVQGQLRKPLDLDDLTGTVGRFCAPRSR